MSKMLQVFALILIGMSSLTACGGGGGDAPPAQQTAEQPAQDSSTWGTMVWDQDDWSS